jgi:hypothetical protein
MHLQTVSSTCPSPLPNFGTQEKVTVVNDLSVKKEFEIDPNLVNAPSGMNTNL